MTRKNRLPWLGAVIAASLCHASAAGAAPPPVALTADTPISAQQGWLAWSVPAKGDWDLVTSHNGVVSAVAVAPRRKPFDVSLGTDASGAPVATYSRCVGKPDDLVSGGVDDWQGKRCRLYVLSLTTGHEQVLPIPHPGGASDTNPSMWRGSVAFARFVAPHADVAQIELWRPGSSSLRTLPHGGMPTDCPFNGGCSGMTRSGLVDGLSYDGQIVSFRWAVSAPAVVGFLGWELRVDRISNGRSLIASAGFDGEVCADGPDSVVPVGAVHERHNELL